MDLYFYYYLNVDLNTDMLKIIAHEYWKLYYSQHNNITCI